MGNKQLFDLNSGCVNYTNITQGVIHITEDKLEVILIKHEKRNHQFYSWTTPLGIFLSCLLATITSNFRDWGFSANTWQAIFVLCTVGTALWLIVAAIKSLKNRKGRGIEDLIEKIKNSQQS